MVALALAFASIFASRSLYGNSFSPIAVYSVGWLLPASCVVFLPHNRRYDGWEITHELWLAVYLSYLAFLGGHFLYLLFIDRGQVLSAKACRIRSLSVQKGWEAYPGEHSWVAKLIRLFFVLGMVGFILNLSNVVSAGGLTLYWELGFRDVETIFGQSTLVNYLYFMNPLVLILGMIFQCRFGYRRGVSFMMTLSFVSLLFHGIKSTIVFPTIVAFIAFFYCGRSLRPKSVAISLALIFLGFQFITVGRNIPFLIARDASWFEIVTYRLDDIFLYFTPGFANLQEEMLNLRNYLGGEESFQFIGEILSFVAGTREGFSRTIFEGEPFYMFNDAYNTGTYLREHYRDFGYIGLCVFPFAYGIMSNFFYCKYLKKPSVRNVALYAIISLMLLVSFFSNHYFKIQYWFWIVMLTAGDGFIHIRRTYITARFRQNESHAT